MEYINRGIFYPLEREDKMGKFNYEMIELLMHDKESREFIAETLASEYLGCFQSKHTRLLDITTYLDKIDLSFNIVTYLLGDGHNHFMILTIGEEPAFVFRYLVEKIRKQIALFTSTSNIACIYLSESDQNVN